MAQRKAGCCIDQQTATQLIADIGRMRHLKAVSYLLTSQGKQRVIKLSESHAFIVKKTPDGLSGGKSVFLRAGKIFNRTGKWFSGSHKLFNQRLISAAEPGIKPGEREA